ncbi:DUF4331 family protein [Telmatocola sphagniphila]|uniref:DUF4331 family protein n=1 Tax=Telmatocola sphagniphila TaxID=1123043 RepID=A0A8E6EV69_9BACT|nr:DUF4331 family protein [Telmatocola sphagniphila]QVL32212.1 DUF4331 family protein [Telmatocola sphagniphila]
MAWKFGSWLGKRHEAANPRKRSKMLLTVLEERDVPATLTSFSVTAGGTGSGIVRVSSATTTPTTLYDIVPYGANFGTNISVAVGDVNGDGIPDIITAPGVGAPANIRVYDGNTGQQLKGTIGSFYAFPPSFTGGVNVAVADLNNDGHADIIVSQESGGSEVRVFDGATGALLETLDPFGGFQGGARVAAADVNGDGTPDIIIGAGPSAGPRVVVYSGLTTTQLYSFYAFDSGFTGGVYVAAGDLANSSTNADIVVGAGPGAGPNVVVLNGASPTSTPIASFYAYDPAFTGGVRVAVGNVPNFGNGIYTTNGPGAAPNTAEFDGSTFTERASFYGAPSGDGGYVAATGPTTSATYTTGVENLYAFTAPDNTNNTVLALTASPFVGAGTSAIFDPNKTYTIHVDNSDVTNPSNDILFQVSFSAPNSLGVQTYTLKEIEGSTVTVLATGTPNSIASLSNVSGEFFAGTADDPSFYDKTGITNFLNNTGTFPRPAGSAVNYYGPNVNDLAMVIEIPTSQLLQTGGGNTIGVWGTSETLGVQTDRVGMGLVQTLLLPAADQSLYNTTSPVNDRANFLPDALNQLENAPYNLTADQATAVANQLLPDMLIFTTGTPFTTNSTDANGFPNGRRLRDDTANYLLNLMTNGAITTDNVPDDNGDRITDGTANSPSTFRQILFPYIGAPNNPGTGPNLN